MKRIAARPADGPVVELIYCQPDKALLVARAEGAVRCHNETDPETCPVITTFEYFDSSSSRSTAAATAVADASGESEGTPAVSKLSLSVVQVHVYIYIVHV
jgi:hypothetical protein